MDREQRELLRRRRRETAQSEHYPVGFAKPPVQHRFSATNQPKRRPRASETALQMASRIAAEKVTMIISGVPRRMQILEAMMRQSAKKGMSGDIRAVESWIKLLHSFRGSPEAEPIDYAAEVKRRLDQMAAQMKEKRDLSTALKSKHNEPSSGRE